jgi:thiosulfate/3-mercaptopyruvate sulfurtransferase
MYTTLIEPAQLSERLSDPDVAVIDCRHELSKPAWGAEAYAAGHIPNARHASLDRDLSGPVGPATGRHPLPAIDAFAATLGGWGIDESVQVVAYDQGPGAYAARLWWMLRWLGHSRVAVLNGGYAAWQDAGLPVTREPGVRTPRRFIPRPADSVSVTAAQLEQGLARGDITLIDARGADRFAGENETIDPVAGHVPGARNRPFTANLDATGRFLSPDALRRGFASVASSNASEIVSMCGSGVTACHNLLAMEIAGLAGARLYPGSWSEWIRDPSRRIARGAN